MLPHNVPPSLSLMTPRAQVSLHWLDLLRNFFSGSVFINGTQFTVEHSGRGVWRLIKILDLNDSEDEDADTEAIGTLSTSALMSMLTPEQKERRVKKMTPECTVDERSFLLHGIDVSASDEGACVTALPNQMDMTTWSGIPSRVWLSLLRN